jgi:hypothetical protein
MRANRLVLMFLWAGVLEVALPPGLPAAEGEVTVKKVEYGGWQNNLLISNGDAELVVTLDVGPRVISYKLKDGKNVFKNYADQMGKSAEKEWVIRGGHRLWIGPEDLTRTYAADNGPVKHAPISEAKDGAGVRFTPAPETEYGIQKEMEIYLAPKGSRVIVLHRITNIGDKPADLAPWALTVMAPGSVEVIPLPPKRPHPGPPKNARSAEDFAPNQRWIVWPFTDFGDGRWHIGTKYITLRQDAKMGPTKLGMAHRMGWVGILNHGTLFVKRFGYEKGKRYPDQGCNFETFTNEDMLECETLGPRITLEPNKSVEHREEWELFGDVGAIKDEAGIDQHILPHGPGK